MNRTDIDKWINGETEVFFDLRQTAPATSDSNRRNEGPPVRRLFWKFTRPAIVIGVTGLGVVTVVGLFTSTRYSGQPFAAADTMTRHIANPTIAMGVSRADEPRPNLLQWTTTLSDAGITTVLKDLVDPPVSPPVPSAALPQRETVTRPAPPEPRTNAKREDRPPTPPEASTPRVDRSSHALLEQESSSLSMANPAAHPLSSNNVARVAMPEALPLPEQANEFINSYWEKVSERSDRVLLYLSSTYAPVVSYYGKLLPKQTVLRDKYYFLRRWPSRETWPSSGAESPSISCDEAAAKCVITGLRNFSAVSTERGARATGVVRYRYGLRFSDGPPQIVAEDSQVVAHD